MTDLKGAEMILEAEAEKPLTPQRNRQLYQLPKGWSAPFNYLVSQSVGDPIIGYWPTMFLAACNGDKKALVRVVETAYTMYEFAKPRWAELSAKEKCVTNAMMQLVNMLSERINEADEAAVREQAARNKPAEPAKPATIAEGPTKGITHAEQQ